MNRYYDFTEERSDDRFSFINYENILVDSNKAVSEDIWRLGRISNSYFSPKKISLITEIKTADEGIILHKISTNPHAGSAFYEFVNENELLEEGFKVNPAKLIGRYVLVLEDWSSNCCIICFSFTLKSLIPFYIKQLFYSCRFYS